MIRRYTKSWLDPTDAVIGEGEIAVDATTAEIKLGDGATEMSALPPYGGGIGKQELWIPAALMVVEQPALISLSILDAGTNNANFNVLDLDGATDEALHFQIPFPKRWNKGTITYRVYWTSAGSDTDAVVWGLQAFAISDNEAIDTAFGTAVLVTDNLQSAAGELYISAESAAVTIANTPAEGDLCFFRLYRDADNGSDTAAEDARVIGLKLFWTSDAATDD